MTQEQTMQKTEKRAGQYIYPLVGVVKAYLKQHPDASAYAISRDLKLSWVTANRYKNYITGKTSV